MTLHKIILRRTDNPSEIYLKRVYPSEERFNNWFLLFTINNFRNFYTVEPWYFDKDSLSWKLV
jgi:hypothetical protein